ncbi:aquaporin family protein (plasmid) [Deinococcus psychrotolerans]|uniref:Aquaporin family protein n=1 Tax=Deinococcus psychrotolerans TaxID=2489213 RepID=A0A3G8YL52_9DEIO|nr:aquaporin [Deinococcus psychrotolerans]AZI45017.1 aquaporin family protein [Deinococcus psychrotolerans]
MSETHWATARRWVAEALGLSGFVAFSLSAAVLAQLGVLPTLAADALVPGLVILALVYGLSDLSGAHFNPAVTLAFALRGSLPWARVPGYLAAQFLGACGGVWLVSACVPLPKAHELVRPWGAFGLETVCTTLLLVILATAKRKAEVGSQAGLVIAGTLGLCLFTAGSVSTIGVNPTRTLAAALFSGTVLASWPHLLGPFAGGTLATGLTYLLRGPLNQQEAETAKGQAEAGEGSSS